MGRIIYPNGGEESIFPADRLHGFSTDEMRRAIDARTIDFSPLADGNVMVVDDRGMEMNLEVNEKATVIYQEGRRTAAAIRGIVLIGTKAEIL